MYNRGRIIYFILMISFIWLYFIGLSSGTQLSNSRAGANTVFEIIIILATLVGFSQYNKSILPSLVCFSVIVFSYLVYESNNVNNYKTLDFVLIYKSVFYLFLFTLPTRASITKQQYKYIYYILLIMFLSKYMLSLFVFDVKRPWVYTENNFELMILLFSFAYMKSQNVNIKPIATIALFSIIILSGSRSAQGCLLFIIFMTFSSKSLSQTIFKYAVLLISIILVTFAFFDRLNGADLSTIDRVLFLNVFLTEMQTASLLEVFVGKPIITPLSIYSCDVLSYYAGHNTLCFSMVLHSYVLRTIYDHGILGLALILYLYFKHFKYLNYDTNFALTVLGIGILNGLSVSSFNSVYFALSIILLKLSAPQSIAIIKRRNS
ncbi:hypothetical protein [Vibrio gallicus]|uniref:hypothetical protein n=1 Tax=Vibrio gallicus TaxID=190897 RepID=UPI0021C498B9|nr:hypothetical protein [Vibrio gallicus]